MALLKQTMCGVLLLVATTSLFLFLYMVVTSDTRFVNNLTELHLTSNSMDDLMAAATMIDVRHSCVKYFEAYYSITMGLTNGQSMLYKQPCQLSNDLHDFHYLISPDACSGDVYMLVLVGSDPSHKEMRKLIRTTWGNPNITGFPFHLVFLVGKMPSDKKQSEINEESLKYGDLIQGSFSDSYYNVTLRDLMGLRWAWQFCKQARFVMHADDDHVIDIYGLIDILQERLDGAGNKSAGDHPNGKQPLTDFIACHKVYENTGVYRDGRYGVSKKSHPADVYENYCSGWLYIMTPYMAYKLDVAALYIERYWLNDAFITGTLVKAVGNRHVNLNVQFTEKVINMKAAKSRSAKSPPKYTLEPTKANVNVTQLMQNKFKEYAQLNGLPKTKWISKRLTPQSY